MILNAYTLYDVKSLCYSPPFFAVSHGAASRMVGDLVSDLNTTVGRHPQDFTLYCIGSFDDQSGQLLQLSPPHHIADAVSFVRDQPASAVFQWPAGPGNQQPNHDGHRGQTQPNGEVK